MSVAPNKIIRDPAFGKRFQIACDNHPDCPPLHQGRLSWIVQQFKIRFNVDTTSETVRKWSVGEVRPRHNTMVMLTQIFEVDLGWFSVGDETQTASERKKRNAIAEGAVNLVAGMIAMDGGHPSFPEQDDAMSNGVDLYAIIRGAHYRVKVVVGEDTGKHIEFPIPANYANLFVIGLVKKNKLNWDVLEIDTETIQKNIGVKNKPPTLKVERHGQQYIVGGDRLNEIVSFADRF